MKSLMSVPASPSVIALAGLAYEAALDPSRWSAFLQQFGQMLRSPACILWAHDFSTQTSDLQGRQEGLGLNLGFDEGALQSFASHYDRTNVWLQNPQLHQSGTVVHSSALFDDRQLPHTEWYADWLRPQDLFYSCAAVVEHAEDRSFNLTVLRSRQAGAYSPDELLWVEQLIPHLRTALTLHRKLHRTQALASASAALLESLPIGVVLLDERGLLLHVSRRAQALMQESQLMELQDNRLHATQSAAQSWLEQAIGQCLQTSSAMAGQLTWLWHPGTARLHGGQGRRLQHWNGQQLHVMVAPMPRAAQPYGMPCGAAVLLSEPGQVFASVVQALRSHYQMTLAEAQLVQALINGLTPKEYADQTGVSIHTVRSQFKTAAGKVGVSRQADLVRAVLMGPAMLQWEEKATA